jgi:hypothetical protein
LDGTAFEAFGGHRMTEASDIPNKINKARVACSVAYLLVALIPILFLRGSMFYHEVPAGSWNIYRFWWCFSSVYFGFAMVAFVHRRVQISPFPDYILMYPFQLLAISSIVFGGLHLFAATSKYLFYYLSFGVGLTMGFMVDSYWSFVTSFIAKGNK